MAKPHWIGKNLHQVQDLLFNGQLTCSDIVSFYLSQIQEHTDLNAFTQVFPEESRAAAAEIDRKIRDGRAGKLAGLVLAVKDNIAISNRPVTCGSRILENFVSPFSATVIEKLLAEDAILIGKTNMDEFAMGSSNETSYWGPVRNPHAPDRIPGGSSGGSAAAVAANLAFAALGSDTGGSIRQPAAMCGVVGVKPTYGRVSRFGLVAFASSFDQIGPITHSVYDAAAILSVIAGQDKRDATTVAVPVPDYTQALQSPVAGKTIGIPKEYIQDGLAPDIRQRLLSLAESLEQAGAHLKEISLPLTEYAVATYYILANAEASSNLERFDGARYGFRAPGDLDLEEMYERSRSEGFGEEVKRRIMMGTYVLSAGYYDAYYRKAQKVRTLIKQEFDRAFESVDCLLTPTSPTTAFRLGEKLDDPLQMYLSDVYTIPANLAGLTAVSVPCGKDGEGLPIGAQIIAPPFAEGEAFSVAAAVEQIADQREGQ